MINLVRFFAVASFLFTSQALALGVAANGMQAGNSIVISLPPGVVDWAVLSPKLGVSKVECGSKEQSNGWTISQYNNDEDKSLCANDKSTNAVDFCSGASWSRGSETLGTCYWQQDRSFQLTVNTKNMRFAGCCVYCNDDARKHPGGYSIKLGWKAVDSNTTGIDEYLEIKNLSKLNISTGFGARRFESEACPSIAKKIDARLPKAPKRPIAHAHANLFLADFDPITNKRLRTIVYGTFLWDSRKDWHKKFSVQTRCEFPSGDKSWILISRPISAFDDVAASWNGRNGIQAAALDGVFQGLIHYRWNVLPELEMDLKACLGERADLKNIRLTGAYFGNEIWNTVNVTHVFMDPRIELIKR